MNVVTMSDVYVTPQSKVNGLRKGTGNMFYGVESREPEFIHHFRSGRRLTNLEKLMTLDHNTPSNNLLNTSLYMGAFDFHYGHFISECIGRTWAINQIEYEKLIWLPSHQKLRNFDWIHELPDWQLSIMRYLNIDMGSVEYITKRTKISKLLVPESGAWLYTSPSQFMLDYLSTRQTAFFGEKNNSGKRNIFVARKPNLGGRIKQIDEIVRVFELAGYEILYPEELSLEDQLHVYHDSNRLVFEAGSTIHTLELFGRLQASVAILPRSKAGASAFRKILAPRVEAIWTYNGHIETLENHVKPRYSGVSIGTRDLLDSLSSSNFL